MTSMLFATANVNQVPAQTTDPDKDPLATVTAMAKDKATTAITMAAKMETATVTATAMAMPLANTTKMVKPMTLARIQNQ